jgi:hypothetical protein
MEIEVLWMNDYLMVMYEVEKTRRARQGYEKEEPPPTGSPPPATGKCIRKRTRRR